MLTENEKFSNFNSSPGNCWERTLKRDCPQKRFWDIPGYRWHWYSAFVKICLKGLLFFLCCSLGTYNSFLFTQDQAMIKKADCLMDTQRKSKKRVLGEEVDSGISHKFIKKIWNWAARWWWAHRILGGWWGREESQGGRGGGEQSRRFQVYFTKQFPPVQDSQVS